MPEDLLRTKLTVPRRRGSAVARPRLLARLDEVLPTAGVWQRALTLVAAPAGFGKTTLLSQWLERCGCAAAWLALDEGDNDPARFLAYVVAALQEIAPGIGEAVLDPLHGSAMAPGGARSPLESALIALLNEMAAVSAPYVLVLDDYHAIEQAAVHQALSYLLENQPPQMHLVVATRVDPPLPVARLRAQAKLCELYAADLCFTLEEATAFLNGVMQLSLAAEQLAALARRTEGWIAGLQLAALALSGVGEGKSPQGPAAFVQAFSGSHRFVLDYLTEEVLSQQSEETKDFLLRTSVLERLSAPLCQALTGRADCQEMLEGLDRANLFIIPLDGKRQWYRYHQLFADLLRQRLQREGPELARELQRKASAWYEGQGRLPEAVQHGLAGEDFERAACLVERHGWAMLMRGEMNTLLRWLAALPHGVVGSRPALGVLRGWALAFTGQWDKVEEALARLEGGEAAGAAAAVRAYVGAVQGNVARTRALAQEALENLSGEERLQRALVTFCLAITTFSSGQPAAAERTLAEVIRLSKAAGQPHLVMTATAHLGHVYEMQGKLGRALETHQEALRLAPGAGERPVPFQGIAYVGLAEVHYERNDLKGALGYAKEGVRLTALGGFTSYMLAGYATLVRGYRAQGDLARSEETMDKAQRFMDEHPFPYMQGVFAELRVRQWVCQGKLAAAASWAESRRRPGDGRITLAREIEEIALARVLMARGANGVGDEADNMARAQKRLAQLLAAAEAAGRLGSAIQILALQAMAWEGQGDSEQALATLARALSLAQPEGFVRTFVDEGAPMARLLRQALAADVGVGYAATLLAAFDAEVAAEAAAPALVEPLSERELQVLRLIVAGLSNREIAAELVIALSTVKSHINNIYGKLGVQRRAQAIARSQELGLH